MSRRPALLLAAALVCGSCGAATSSTASPPPPTIVYPTLPTPSLAPNQRLAVTPSPYQGTVANGLVTYIAGGLTFEYPVTWRVITGNFDFDHYDWLAAALGTGDWKFDCIEQLDSAGEVKGVSCPPPELLPGPNGVEVEISSHGSPAFFVPTTPPDAETLSSGLPYTVEANGSRTTWHIYETCRCPTLDVIAQFSDPPNAAALAQVEALVQSITVSR